MKKNKRNHSNLLVLALFAAGAVSANAEQDVISRSFPVKAGGKLVLNVDRGALHISTSDSDKVDVKITRELKHASASEAKNVFEQQKIEMSSSDNVVRIMAESPKKVFRFNNPLSRLQVVYTIAIPAKFDLDLRTAGGSIHVGDLEGKAILHTSGGNLKLGAIKGLVKAHTSGGSITLGGTEGDVDASTSGGDLRLGEINGDLVAHTSGGQIIIEKTTGSVKVSTSGGDIRMKDARGPVTAHTSGGNVSAQLSAQPAAGCSLKTSGGNVDVLLSSNLALDLEARTSGGRVNSDFPGTLNKEKNRLTARLNGGGPDLVLETSGGNVNIRSK